MKKILYGTAVAVLAMFSACEMLEPLDEELDMAVSGASGASPQVIFTATLGLDSKTTLEYDGEAYKTVWTDNDIIYVIDPDTGTTEACSIVDGMGTKTATFAGTLQADSYIAVYGNNVRRRTDGSISLSLSSWQSFYGSFSLWSFPMVAQSDSKSFSFKNLCSVLNLRVTGNGEILNNIRIRSNDSEVPVYGDALIDLSGEEPSLDLVAHNEGADEFLYVGTWTELNAEPSDIYIVLPAQTYPGGFTLTLVTDDNEEKSFVVTDDVEMRRSRIRNLNISFTEGTSDIPDEEWVIEMTEDNGESWSVTQNLTYDGEYFYFDDLYVGTGDSFYFCFRETNTGMAYGCSQNYRSNNYKTNTRVNLAPGSSSYLLKLSEQGYYDIYLDPEEDCFFIMSDYTHPDDLPTKDDVIYESASDIDLSLAGTGEYVKVHGVVLAQTSSGFVLAIDGWYYNNIYVYDLNTRCPVNLGNWVDLYAKVGEDQGMPQLVVADGEYWCSILNYNQYDYDAETPVVVETLAGYAPGTYEYFRYTGIYSNHTVKGESETNMFLNIIPQYLIDMDQYEGKRVCVEGYYAGANRYSDIPRMILKRVIPASDENLGDGSIEGIVPGTQFPVTIVSEN